MPYETPPSFYRQQAAETRRQELRAQIGDMRANQYRRGNGGDGEADGCAGCGGCLLFVVVVVLAIFGFGMAASAGMIHFPGAKASQTSKPAPTRHPAVVHVSTRACPSKPDTHCSR